MTHETYAAASDYLISGYAVVPLHGVEGGHCTCRRGSDCSCAGKHPIRRDWAHQPIRTQEDLHSFWKGRLERPTNIGILLDSPQRLLLIDVDTKNAKLGENTIRDWSADIQIDLATYRLQDTPSGGWHCLFRVPETYERTLPNRAEVGPGVDVLCRDKQCVVSPPQTDKGRYSGLGEADVVLPPFDDLPEAPKALLEHLSALGSRTGASEARGDPADLDALKGPTVDIVRKVVKHTPNGEDVGYDDYIRMAHYIKGACGREYESEARESFHEWADRWEGGDNASDINDDKFDSVAWDRLRSGWPQLLRFCEGLGLDSAVHTEARVAEAQEQFNVETDPDKIKELKARERTASGWQRPIPVVGDDVIEPFPTDSLSPVFRRYVESVAATQEVPVDVPAINLLGGVAGAAQGSYHGIRVHDDYYEPLSLYLISQLHSGEGKSAVVSEFRRPFERAQAILRERAKPKIAKAATHRELKEQDRKAIQAEIKSTGKELRKLLLEEGEDAEQNRVQLEKKRESLSARLEQLSTELAASEVPTEPLLWLTEGTPEAISQHLAAQGNLVVSGAEGDLVDVFAGQYTSGGTAKLGPLLSAYSGESYSEARMDGTREVREPRLTIQLTVQPSVIEKMQQQPEFASRGLTPRFLYSAPKSLVGSRSWDMSGCIDRSGRAAYQTLIAGLLGADPSSDLLGAADLSDLTNEEGEEGRDDLRAHNRSRELCLSQEAFERYRRYRQSIEPALVDEEDALSGFAAWGNKLPGQMLRIAGVLHLAERAEIGDERPWETQLQPDTIGRAIKIAEYFRAHMVRLFVRRPQVRERLVLDWLREEEKPDFSPRDLFRSKHRQFDESMDVLHETLTQLEQMGWIRKYSEFTPGRSAQRYHVNPCLWEVR